MNSSLKIASLLYGSANAIDLLSIEAFAKKQQEAWKPVLKNFFEELCAANVKAFDEMSFGKLRRQGALKVEVAEWIEGACPTTVTDMSQFDA